MSTPEPYWDGQQWLYWDGTRWVPQAPPASVPTTGGAPTPGAPASGGSPGPRTWVWLVVAAVVAVAVAGGAYWLGTRVAIPDQAATSATPSASDTPTTDSSTPPASPGTPSAPEPTTQPTPPSSESATGAATPTFPAELGRAATVVDGFLGALQAGDLEAAWGFCTQEFLDMGALGPLTERIRSYRILNAEPAGDSVAVTVEEDWGGGPQEQIYYVVTWEGPPLIGAIEYNVPEPPGS